MAVRRTADDLARSLALSQSAVRARLAQEDTYTHEISFNPKQGTSRHTNTCQPGLGPRPRSPTCLMIDFVYISLSYSYDCLRLKLTPQRSQYFTSNLFSIQRAPILVPRSRFEWFVFTSMQSQLLTWLQIWQEYSFLQQLVSYKSVG